MNHLLKNSRILAFAAGAVLATWLLGAPGKLSDSVSNAQLTGAALWAVLFSLSLLGWGYLLQIPLRPFRQKILVAALLGSLFLSAVMALAGSLRLLGEGGRAAYLGIVFAGFFGLPLPRQFRRWEVIPAVILGACVLKACFFLPMTRPQLDVYAYHLYAPWSWWTAGKISFVAGNPHLFLASYWDYLYLWGFPLLGSQGSSLYLVLLFSQLMHAMIGFGGTIAALFALSRRGGAGRSWAIAAAMFGVTLFPLLWTAWTAKNDFGSLLWLLGALYFLLHRRSFLFGIFAGAAVAAKASSAFYLLFALSLFPFFFPWRVRSAVQAAGGALLALLPFLARNYFGAGSPFFPLLLNVFPAQAVSRTIAERVYGSMGEGSSGGLAHFAQAVLMLAVREPLVLIFVTCGIFLVRTKTHRFLLAAALLALIAEVFWLGAALRDDIYLRYLAPSMVILLAIPLAALGRMANRRNLRREGTLLLVGVAALFIFTRSYFPWQLPSISANFADAYVNGIDGGACKIWLADHAEAGASVASIEDYNLFLMPFRNLRVAVQDRALDELVRIESDPEKLFRIIGARYAYQVIPSGVEPFYKRSGEI
ncbi:MAG: hypothetical protein ACXVA8_11870, partial [Bdellovibrionota bacterium]